MKMDQEVKAESNLWYLDNGAINHMTGLHSKFKELNESITRQVKFGEESLVDIKGKRTMLFKRKNAEEIIFERYISFQLCAVIK